MNHIKSAPRMLVEAELNKLAPGAYLTVYELAEKTGQPPAAVKKVVENMRLNGLLFGKLLTRKTPTRCRLEWCWHSRHVQYERDTRPSASAAYEPLCQIEMRPARDGAMVFVALPSLAGGQRVGYRPPILNCGKTPGEAAFAAPRITMRNLE